jgi:hypothetical protein
LPINWYRYERTLDVATFDDQWKGENKKRKLGMAGL